MRIRWFGHACFFVEEAGSGVLVDPFDHERMGALPGLTFAYPPVAGIEPDLILVTHDHPDHDGSSWWDAACPVVRRAGRYVQGRVVVDALSAHHDSAGGRELGQVVILSWRQGGRRLCHLGDCGHSALSDEQVRAVMRPDVLFVPVGGPPTLDAQQALAVVRALEPTLAVPMHYRTPAINFLEPVHRFVELAAAHFPVRRMPGPGMSIQSWPAAKGGTTVCVLEAPAVAERPGASSGAVGEGAAMADPFAADAAGRDGDEPSPATSSAQR